MPWKDQDVLDALKDSYDLEEEYKLEKESLNTKKFKDKLDIQRFKQIDQSLNEINHIRTGVIENNPGVYEAYAQKYKTVQGPPEAESTSPLAGLLRGAKETVEFGVKHPMRAAAHASEGLKDFASLPFRLAETGIMGEKGEFPYLSTKRGMREAHERLRQGDIEAGVVPDSTGPAVSEAVGGMLLPVGPTLKAGQHLKNILKGGAFTGAISAGEELADTGDITAERTGTAVGAGGAVTGLLSSLIGRGRTRIPSGAEGGPAPSTTEPVPRPTPPGEPRLLEAPVKPGEIRRGTIFGRGRVQGEGEPVISGAIPGEEVPNVPMQARSLKDVLGIKSPAQASEGPVIEAKGRVVPEESPVTAKAIEQTKKASGKDKLLTPEEAINISKQMDLEKETIAKEATLRDVISGKTDVSKVPMKRGPKKAPKSEAPAPAVEGEVGAPKDFDRDMRRLYWKYVNYDGLVPTEAANLVRQNPKASSDIPRGEKIGDVTEFNIPEEAKLDFFAKGEIAAKVKAPFVERRIEEAKQRLALGKIAESKPIPKEVPLEKPQLELPLKRTEDFIKEQGYTVREREPFPGEKEYDIIDPKSGNVLARGDRRILTETLGTRPEAKGIKLYSFPPSVEEFGDLFKSSLRKAGAKVPEGVEVENMPHRAGIINTLLRPLETPEFNVRKSAAGRTITDAGREADRQINRRVRDLINEEIVPGKTYRPTQLSTYFAAPAESRAKVDKVLVLGDKAETVYTPEQLARHGLTPEEISAYQGVRNALDKVVEWVKELGDVYKEFDSRKIPGYIPRVWKGDWEIFVNGNKYLRPKSETSSFSTLGEAASEAHTIKASSKDAKVAIRFFPDPEYLSSRGLADARVIARLKSNLERMGHMDSATIDEAFKMGKSVKGFAKHLLERKDAVGYETQDLDKVLNSYFYQAARRVEMQKVKDVAESVLKEHKADLSAGQVQYMQEYVERVAGKPAWDQIAIHQFVQDTPIGKWIDPIRGGKLISSGRELVTHLTLGFGNVGWAMINLDGLTRHVWPLLAQEGKLVGAVSPFASEQYMLKGIQGFFKDKGLRQQLAHHGVIDIQLMSEPTPKIGHEFGKGAWTPERISMLLGTATEEFSRGVAAIARYHMAIDHGASPALAMQAAARFVEQTLGRYSRGGRPPAFTGAIGSTVGLFKTYMSVMLQDGWRAFESKDVGTISRYIIGAVGVSGVLGLVPGIENMDSALTKQIGWSPIETIEKNLPPAVSTGLFSVAGVDISRRAGVPEVIPNDARGWAGPVLGRFASTIADVANGEYGEAILDMLPNSIRNIVAVARGYKEGKVIGRMDKPTYEVTPKEAALHAVGLTPSREAAESRLYQRNVNKEAYRESTLDHLTRKIAQGKATDADYAKFAELGGKSRRIRNEQRRENQTLIERQYKHLPKILRREQPAS